MSIINVGTVPTWCKSKFRTLPTWSYLNIHSYSPIKFIQLNVWLLKATDHANTTKSLRNTKRLSLDYVCIAAPCGTYCYRRYALILFTQHFWWIINPIDWSKCCICIPAPWEILYNNANIQHIRILPHLLFLVEDLLGWIQQPHRLIQIIF